MKNDPGIEKTALMGAFHVNRLALIECARGWPQDKAGEIFLGSWSLLDLLAHLAGWDEANYTSVAAVQAGKLPEYYIHHNTDWRKFNAILVTLFREPSLEQQIARVMGTFKKLEDCLAALDVQAFYRDYGVRFRSYKVIISRLIESELKDERVHLEQMSRYAETFIRDLCRLKDTDAGKRAMRRLSFPDPFPIE